MGARVKVKWLDILHLILMWLLGSVVQMLAIVFMQGIGFTSFAKFLVLVLSIWIVCFVSGLVALSGRMY